MKTIDKIKFSTEEWNIIKKIIKLGVQIELDTYVISEQVALVKTEQGIRDSLNEMVEDTEELEIILKLRNDKDFIKRINELTK